MRERERGRERERERLRGERGKMFTRTHLASGFISELYSIKIIRVKGNWVTVESS